MRSYRLVSLALVAPALVVLATVGCGKKDDDSDGGGGGGKPSKSPTTKSGGSTTGAKTPLEGKGVAVLKGTVTFDGDAPTDDGSIKKAMSELKSAEDKKVCESGDTTVQSWKVNPDNKGVANVVIWVKPPDGKYFKPDTPDEAVWKKTSDVIDQPHCAFEPHVSVAFASYYDGKGVKKANDEVTVKNGSPILHNTKWAGNPLKNPGGNPSISAGKQEVLKVNADDSTPIKLECTAHPFMNGYIWALDTPYYAVTDKDGKFEIKGIPAGAEVSVVKWHEGTKFIGGAGGEKKTLTEGDNTLDFKVKK